MKNFRRETMMNRDRFGAVATADVVARNVAAKSREPKAVAVEKIDAIPARELKPEEVKAQRRRRSRRKRRTLKARLLMVGAWLACLVIVLMTVQVLKKVVGPLGVRDEGIAGKFSAEEKAFYFQEKSAVFNVMSSFLMARQLESKSNFVTGSARVVAMMGPYYESHEMRAPVGELSGDPVFWNLRVDEEPAFLEAAWRDSSGQSFEAVFSRSSRGWALDWPQFTRYSAENWTYFRQRFSSQNEGVFRLWVEIFEGGENNVSFRFVPAESDSRVRDREASPVLEVPRMSPEGEFLAEAVALRDVNVNEEGYRLMDRDPERLYRVQVELAWVLDPLTEEYSLKVNEFLAHHWRSLSKE